MSIRSQESSDLLFVSFNLTVPTGCLIHGISVTIVQQNSYPVSDVTVQLYYQGVPLGVNKAKNLEGPGNITYGGLNDTWGYDLDYSIITDHSFGIAYGVTNLNSFPESQGIVVGIQLLVYYVPGFH